MATSRFEAVKCLNKSSGRQRFVFKAFSKRVEEIHIDVFRSLEPVKAEPSDGSSFFRECLLHWRELNTAEDFISFYEEMMPLVQTLPQILLHKEKIFSELLRRLHMKARLSLEPILMLIAALSRDILKEFLPFLQRLTDSLVNLLKRGGDRDPEILEQVFTSWSCMVMYLQRYLIEDVVYVLKMTVHLRYFPKDYVQEFMAEAVSLLLRNSPINQLIKGIKNIVSEVAKSSSPLRGTGVTALLHHVMRGTSSTLHSRAETVLRLLMDKSILSVGSDEVLDTIAGSILRLCEQLDHKECHLIFKWLFEEISNCLGDGCLVHLNRLLAILISTVRVSNGSKLYDSQSMIKLVRLLIQSYIVPSERMKSEDYFFDVLNKILQLMLCLLDVPLISGDLSSISLLFAPAFKLRNSRLLTFIKGLLLKDPQIAHAFGSHIISALDDLIEVSPEEVLFLMLRFFARQEKQQFHDAIDRVSEENVSRMCCFFKETLLYWVKLINGIATNGDQSNMQVSESGLAVLWGTLSCYPHVQHSEDGISLLMNLVGALDQLLETEADSIASLPKSTWQSLLAAALTSYHKLLLDRKTGLSEAGNFLRLVKRNKSSLQVLLAVAEYLDFVLGDRPMGEADARHSIFEELNVQQAVDSINTFTDNLSLPNKTVRVSTLRILRHYAPLGPQLSRSDEHPHKKLKTEESEPCNEDSQCRNVVQLLLSVEETPLSIPTSRTIIILISRIQMALTAAKISDGYIPLLLHGMIGLLHNRFGHIWEPAVECLTILIGKYKELIWDRFVEYLGNYQAEFLSSGTQLVELNSKSCKPNSLGDCFSLFLVPDSDSTPCTKVIALLLQSLQKIPDIAESRSRQVIPIFFKFLGYADDNISSIESFSCHSCQEKVWRLILKEWLNLLRLMRNARSLYRSRVLKEVLMNRLLDETDPDIQLKVLDCLLNWRDDFLLPYDQHLKNLIISKNIREELTTWNVSKESQYIQEGHRAYLIPLIIRLLIPKVRKLKTLASRKHAGLNHRRAVLSFLAQLDVDELQLFFSLLIKPLLPNHLGIGVVSSQFESPCENFIDRFQSSIIVKCSTSMNVANLSCKKRYGFLHVTEDILKTFDELHITPFLNPLMKIVVRILENCTLGLTSANNSEPFTIGDNSTGASKVHETNTVVPNSLMMNTSIKQLKDLRSLCLKIISFVLHKHGCHDFGSDFWDIFFMSVKPLIDSFKQEGSSSEKPSSLFSCFLAMSQNPTLISLLNREANLVPTIFSILTVRSASDAIISCVLNFIENLLNLDNDSDDQEEGESVKRVFMPHLEALILSFRGLFQFRKEGQRKSPMWPGKTEVRIFKLLAKYIKEPLAAGHFVDILLPYFRKKAITSDECLEALHVVKEILAILGGETTGKVLNAIHPLLVSARLDVRLFICCILGDLAVKDPSLAFLAKLLSELNAVSSSQIGELDYDTRLNAYERIRPELFSLLEEDHALAILSHCVYDMSSEELIFRQSASRSLLSFIQFAAPILNMDANDCQEMLSHDVACKETMNGAVETFNTSITWTKVCTQRIIRRTFLQNIGKAMSKDVSIQKEWVALLRDMVYNLQGVSSLNSLRPLCSEDAEVDFFNNILHLQIHRRARALQRFRNVISAGNFSENVTVKIFVPLFFNMLFDVKDGKGEHLRNACLESIASISGLMQWESYRALLMRCFREMTLKPDKQKIILRLICAILGMFHFSHVDSSQVLKDGRCEVSDSSTIETKPSNTETSSYSESYIPTEIQVYLQKIVLPQIQKLLTSDPDSINVNISLAALKLLKLLPVETMESQLPSVIHRICNFLKHRLDSIRDEARLALAACAKELGIEYLHFIVKVVQATLKRGFELHVLGYTLHFILSRTLMHPIIGKLDYCLEELLSIAENDILGDVAEEKEVDKIASRMKETRKSKSFETLKLISQSITFKTHVSKLLSPIYGHLQTHVTPKKKVKLEMMLHHIASGIESNPSVEQMELFIYIYGLIEDGIAEEDSRGKVTSMTGDMTKSFPPGDHLLQSSHLIAVFALGLLHNRLKNMKLDKKDEQLLSMLDPFVKLLGNCLNSKYEDILSAAFKCLAPLIRLPLPSLEAQAENIKILLLDIAQKSGNASGPLVQSCLKLLTALLQSTRISLSNDQLHMLIQSPLFIDLQNNPSPIALSLLKSIVRRKLVVHEIYDVVMQVAELMVTCQLEPIRKKCSHILLQFLLDYRLSDKRLQQHLDFLLTNLSYEHSYGREAVLEMLHAILIKFPKSVIDSHAQSFFLHLVVALANDRDNKVRSMVATVIKVLIGRSSEHALHPIWEYSLSWYMGEKQHLWSAAAQVLGLLVEVPKMRFHKHISSILQVAKGFIKSSVDFTTNKEVDFSNEPAIPFWKEAYHSLVMLEKMLLNFPELCFDRNLEGIWEMIDKLLLHRHIWLRNISSRLVSLYFATVSDARRVDHEKLKLGTLFLMNPSRLFAIAVSFLNQLKAQITDDAVGNLITQNLVFSIYGVHSFARQSNNTPLHDFWSTLDPREQGCYLGAFELLGSGKARSLFLLSTNNNQNNQDDLQSLLIAPLLKQMGKIAIQREDTQMKIIFNCFRKFSSEIGTEGCDGYRVHMLLPLYKVCEGFAGKVIGDEVKQLAEEVRDSIKDVLGVDKFVQTYNMIRKHLKEKRDKRKQEEKVIAVINPMRYAKRKLRIAAKHSAHKKRKLMSMKTGPWRR